MNAVVSNDSIALSDRVRYRSVGNEGVLVHLKNGRVIVVNEVGLFILQQLDTPKTIQELSEAVARKFDVSLEKGQADIDVYLKELDFQQILKTPGCMV